MEIKRKPLELLRRENYRLTLSQLSLQSSTRVLQNLLVLHLYVHHSIFCFHVYALKYQPVCLDDHTGNFYIFVQLLTSRESDHELFYLWNGKSIYSREQDYHSAIIASHNDSPKQKVMSNVIKCPCDFNWNKAYRTNL